MFFKNPFMISLFRIFNILIAIVLLTIFLITDRNIVLTFPVANMAALNYLRPVPMNYFWDLNINNAPANRDLLRYYADYYEHLLRAYPCLRDSYSILGYSYHYLGDDQKAEDYLIKAIHYDPAYAWNYYNLASLYINHSRYPEALQMLQRLEKVDPQLSLTKMFSSYLVFFPLLSPGGHDALSIVSQHLKATYRACAVLEDQLNLIPEDKDVERMVKKMNLELYAF